MVLKPEGDYPEQWSQLKRAEELTLQVEELLNHPEPQAKKAADALRQALDIVNQDSAYVFLQEEIRQNIIEEWLTLVSKVGVLRKSQLLLREGLRRFANTSSAEQFKEKIILVNHGLSIEEALKLSTGERYPSWLEQNGAPKQLKNLFDSINHLIESSDWDWVQDNAKNQQKILLEEMLPTYLQSTIDVVQQAARQRNFAQAIHRAELALQLTSEDIHPRLPKIENRETLLKLDEALTARQQSEVLLYGVAVDLTTRNLPFQEVVSYISLTLPQHPDVPIDDLKSFKSDLEIAGQMEKHQGPWSTDNYAENIRQLYPYTQLNLNIEKEPPPFLTSVDPQLAQNLRNRFLSLQNQINQAVINAVIQLSQNLQDESDLHNPAFDPTPRITNHWQLTWCLISGVIPDPSLKATAQRAIVSSLKAPHILLNRAAQIFDQATEERDIARLQRTLIALRKLNQGLAYLPEKGNGALPLASLPSLPKEKNYPVVPCELDDAYLEDFYKIVTSWSARTSKPDPLQQQATTDSNKLLSVNEIAGDFLKDLYELRVEIFPNLGLEGWDEDSTPARLEREARFHLALVSVLRESEEGLRKREGMEVLTYLDDELQIPRLTREINASSTWLLERIRRFLLRLTGQIRQRGIEELKTLTVEILRDTSTAPRRLKDEILTKQMSLRTAKDVESVLAATSNRLAKSALNSKSREKALNVWGSVQEATSPWSEPSENNQKPFDQSAEVVKLWQTLHLKSSKEKNSITQGRQNRMLAFGFVGVIALVLLGWFGVNAFFLQPQEQTQQTALAFVATGTENEQQTQAAQTATVQQVNLNLTATTVQEQIQLTDAALSASQTAQWNTMVASTQEAATEQAIATANALQETEIAQTATAEIELNMTQEALRCLETANYDLTISSEPDLSPSAGTTFIIGSQPFTPSASWDVTNLSTCEWEQLTVLSLSDTGEVLENTEVNALFQQDGQTIDVSSAQKIGTNEEIQIVLEFDLFEANDVESSWVLVANGLNLLDQPYLELDVQNWVIAVAPTPVPTQAPTQPPPTEKPKPKPKPTDEPEPTSPPSRPTSTPPSGRPTDSP